MPRKKQKRIDEIENFDNVFRDPKAFRNHLNNQNTDKRIVLEIGCGHGYYTLALAERFPEKYFVGVDKKADRLWKAGTWALEQGRDNAVFIKADASGLQDFFAQASIGSAQSVVVDEIWVTFPDPCPKPSSAGKRLTSPHFLEVYRTLLNSGGVVHLKTDNKALFDYSVETARTFGCNILEIIEDVHNQRQENELLEILTFYERKFMNEGHKIYYMRFTV